MLLQKGQIGKTAVILIILTLLAALATLPLFLQADTSGEATPEANLFLPVVYNKDESTPTPTVTATICPLATQEPFIIEPVTSPTSELSQTLVVRLGRGEWVRATGPAGTVTVDAPDLDGYFRVTVPLAADTANDVLVEGKVELVGTPGETCVYGGYILSKTVTIVHESETPTATPTPSNTVPAPADLIVGQPRLISTPPIIVYEPVAFQVPVTNTGDIAINDLFFVDLLFDPQSGHPTDVYAAVSGLGGNSGVTLTITSPIGFANFVGTHQVTGWVDSLDHIVEADETNNLSDPLGVPIANYGGTPTNTPMPTGTATISGSASVFVGGSYRFQERMFISAIDESSGLTIATTYSDENGFYQFDNLTTGIFYTVTACITIDNNEYFGIRTNREAPTTTAHIFANPGACP